VSAASPPAVQAEPKHPEITEVVRSGDLVEMRLAIPEALPYFRGHFPGFAILPGVVHLDWAIYYARQSFVLGAGAPATVQIKFIRPIRPDHRVTLTLKYAPARNRVQFDYSDVDGPCSSGRIGFTIA